MSTASPPSSTVTATTAAPNVNSVATGTPIKLPSISELTSRSNTSPRLSISDSSKLLPSLSSTSSSANITSPFKYQPLKPTTQSNYILHNAANNTTSNNSISSVVNSLPKITSPALPPQQQLPPASSISPVTRLINTPPQQSISASTSPNSQYQYYQYPQQQQQQQPPQHSPIMHPQQSQQQYPQPAYYPQPVYYQGGPPPPPPGTTIMGSIPHQPQVATGASIQPSSAYPHPAPEVVNKPINKCHRCGTTETPEWRRGPKGVRTLCNACGLFHAKLVKRKGAALAAEEVLNNKVTKGKNGRRISIKKHLLNESLKNNGIINGVANVNVNIAGTGTGTGGAAAHYYNPQPQQQQQQQQQIQPPIQPIAVQVVGKLPPHHPQGISLPPPVHYNTSMMVPPLPQQPQPHVIPVYQNGQIPLIRH